MSGEIRPIFSKEAEEQLQEVLRQIDNIFKVTDQLANKKLNIGGGGFKQLTNDLQGYQTAVKNQTKGLSDLDKAYVKLAEAQSDEGKALVELRTQIAQTNAETKKQFKEATAILTPYQEQRKLLKELQAEAKNLALTEGEGSKAFKEKSKQASDLALQLQGIDKATGDYSSTVGRYEQEVTKAILSTGAFGSEGEKISNIFKSGKRIYNQVTTSLTTYTTAQNAATGAQNLGITSLQKMRIALIATGIGAIAVLVGTLATAFFSTQRGADTLTRALEPIKAIFGALFGVVQNFSFALVDAFTNPREAINDLLSFLEGQFINRLKAPIEVLKGIATLDFKRVGNGLLQGFTGVENVIGKTNDFLAKNLKIGSQIADNKIKISELESELALNTEKRAEEERKLQLITKDTSASYKDRQKAVDAVLELTRQQVEEELKIIDLQIENLKLEQSKNDTKRDGRDGLKELNKLEAERLKIAGKIDEKEKENIRVISGLKKEQQAEAEKALKKEMDRLAVIRELSQTEAQNLEDKLKAKLKELKLDKDISQLNQAEQQARTKLLQEYNDQLTELEKKGKKTIVERTEQLISERSQLISNIEKLKEYLDVASPENQKLINAELEKYQSTLEGVNTELVELGSQLPLFADAQGMIDKAVKDTNDSYQKLLENIDLAYKSGAISAEQYYEQINEAQATFVNDTIDGTAKMYEDILALANLSAEDRAKAEDNLLKAKEAIRKRELDGIKKLADEETKTADATAKKVQDIKKSATKVGFDIAKAVGDELFAREKEKLDAELSEYETANAIKLENDIALATAQGATAQELEAIKAKADSDLAKKRSEINRKQAIEDKKKAMFDIILNTAIAVTAGLAKPAVPPFPSAIAAGVVGAVNLALVSARPIPAFAEGVRNFEGGRALVGEAGREIVETPNGSFIADKPMVLDLPKFSNVYSNPETEKMLSDGTINEIRGLRKDFKGKKMTVNNTIIVQNDSRIAYFRK